MPLIKIIIGSTRPNRFGPQPAHWLMELTKDHTQGTFELIDLAEINLPFLDEPDPSLYGRYVHEHSKQWSKMIDEADAYIIITPEYNRGPSGALKNAIDFAAKEWYYKPVAFVSYGAGAGGARAVEQLHNTFVWLRAYNMHDELHLRRYWEQLDNKGQFVPTDEQTADAHRLLKNIIFWSTHMKGARAELKKRDDANPAGG